MSGLRGIKDKSEEEEEFLTMSIVTRVADSFSTQNSNPFNGGIIFVGSYSYQDVRIPSLLSSAQVQSCAADGSGHEIMSTNLDGYAQDRVPLASSPLNISPLIFQIQPFATQDHSYSIPPEVSLTEFSTYRRYPFLNSVCSSVADHQPYYGASSVTFPTIQFQPPENLGRSKEKSWTVSECTYKVRCSICLEDFKTQESVTCLPCFHIFHPLCIDCVNTTSLVFFDASSRTNLAYFTSGSRSVTDVPSAEWTSMLVAGSLETESLSCVVHKYIPVFFACLDVALIFPSHTIFSSLKSSWFLFKKILYLPKPILKSTDSSLSTNCSHNSPLHPNHNKFPNPSHQWNLNCI